MTQRLVVASLVRNESAKYWRSCLDQWSKFADEIVVLDDNSTDDTALIAEDAGADVYYRSTAQVAWGNESSARQHLFELAREKTRGDDVILFLDADMVPARNPRDLIHAHADTYFFTLYDLWSAREYRSDFWWRGHINPRAWMIRRPSDEFVADWNGLGVHCGHFPSNYVPENAIIAPAEYALLHYAYADPRDRDAKWQQYLKVGAQLSPQQFTHAQSILDPSPDLLPLPFEPHYTLTRAT